MTTFVSNLEKNKETLMVGDIVVYSDVANYAEYRVVELFDGGLCVAGLDDNSNLGKGIEEDLFFDSLQLGWSISVKTMKFRLINGNVKYQMDEIQKDLVYPL